MSDTTTALGGRPVEIIDDPTAAQGPVYLNPSHVLSAGQSDLLPEGGRYVPPGTKELPEKLRSVDKDIEQQHKDYLEKYKTREGRLTQAEQQRPPIPNQQQLGTPPDA